MPNNAFIPLMRAATGIVKTGALLVIGNSLAITTNSCWNVVNFRGGLIAGLQADGCRVTVIAPQDESTPRLTELGVDYIHIDLDPRKIALAKDIRLLHDYYRILRRLRPGALLGFTPKANAFGSLAAQLLGIPTINNMTGMAFVERSGLARMLPMQLLKLAFLRSRIVFFQNSDDRDLFLSSNIVKPRQARLLPGSGVDLSRFLPQATRSPADGEFRLLLIARLLWEKGIGEYVAAARLLRKKMPTTKFQLLGFLDVQSPSAVPRVEVEGWVSEGLIEYLGSAEDVRPFIAAADCIVLPSYREGLPRTLLEAAAMCKPVIASNVPGCRHVVQPQVTGLLCEPRDALSLSHAIMQMASFPPEQREKMGTNARLRVEREFNQDLVTERYVRALREIY